ncbi:MAG: MBL fold metallo-hydrolase [Actinomycetota bacterium]
MSPPVERTDFAQRGRFRAVPSIAAMTIRPSLAAPTITMVGHASVVIEAADIVLWTDPWLVSRAFNNSWAIHPAPTIDDELRERVTHIWISHEHPDHFNVPTLKQLAPTMAKQVEVVMQAHPEQGPVTFLRAQGFSVTELEPGHPSAVGAVTLTSYPIGHEDAALMVESNGWTILNLNDCKPTKGEMRRLLGAHGPVDVLLDQFSGAGWNGNPGDAERKRAQAERVRSTLAFHLDEIDPVWFVPFASFVRFEHAENTHVAEERITVADTVARHADRNVAVLAPGDRWTIDDDWDGTTAALARYAAADAEPFTPATNEPVSPSAIIDAAKAFAAGLSERYQTTVLRRVRPTRFVVSDGTDTVVDLTVIPGTGIAVDDTRASTTVHLSSQAAHDAFARRWGMSTLLISGRFTIDGPEAPFTQLKQLSAAAAVGLGTRGLRHRARNPRMRALIARTMRRRLP